MAKTLETITATALEARQAFEQRTIPQPLLRSLYLAYYPSCLDVDQYLDFTGSRFPKGNCDLAAVYLQHVLGEGEVVEGHYIVEPHTFLALGKLAVDITADQFGGPAVYVGPVELPWNR